MDDWDQIRNPGRHGAALVLIRHPRDLDLILAVSRRNDPNDFGLPGGKVDPGEDFASAGVRELFEETGMVVDPSSLVEVYRGPGRTHEVRTFVIRGQQPLWTARLLDNRAPGETGRVAYVEWDDLESGTFRDYNTGLHAALTRMIS